MKPNKLTILLLIVLSAVINQFVNAQIVFTDVNPDVTTPGTYHLDLNNDSTTDFVIRYISESVKGSGGIYLIRMQTHDSFQTGKLVVVK